MFRIGVETADDWWEVESLFDLTFAPGRTALSSYRLRDGVDPVAQLCLTLRDADGVLAASVRFWPIQIGEGNLPALLLGPIAVHPTRQGEGLGAMLMANALDRARDLGWKRVILVGDFSYYKRFGFRRDLAEGLVFPPPTLSDRVLAQELVDGAMAAVVGKVKPWRTGAVAPD